MTICDSLLDIAERAAQEHRAKKIKVVKVRIGELSGVVPELLEHAFEICSPERELTRGARLILERVKPRARCRSCEEEFEPEDYIFLCPSCGSGETELLAGDELLLDRLELEV